MIKIKSSDHYTIREDDHYYFLWSGSFENFTVHEDLFVINRYDGGASTRVKGRTIIELFSNHQEALLGNAQVWVKRLYDVDVIDS